MITKRLVGIAASFALVSVLLIAGCATTTGSDRSAAASVTMAQVEDDIRLLVMELTATNSALASLVNPLQSDLTTAYGVFSDGHAGLEKASDQFVVRSDQMGTEGREYFNEWRIQGNKYENPQIQALSEQRRSELSEVYAQIADSSVGIQGELKQYVSNVKEVKTYFSTDLTARGVTAMSPFANRTIIDGFNLSVKLDNLLKSVAEVRAELSPGDTVAVK
ncbi:MAG: hypothetical protein EA382_13020 [Spirochaetaceae bacterium]|nr:MAG: hypothetical protein EA382_13020 [Spirochaetaceae bacterium]